MAPMSARSSVFSAKPDSAHWLLGHEHVDCPAAMVKRSNAHPQNVGERKPSPAARTAHLEPVLLNFGHAGRPLITQRPSGSAALRARAVSARAKKIEGSPEPGSGRSSARRKQSLDPLELKAGVARPLVELDPRHAFVPQVCFQHGALHSAHVPDRSRGRSRSNIAPGSKDV